MESEQPLLSICIPTYNRCQYLQGALENIVSDKAFNTQIEIVISDNASDDGTQQLGEEYARKFENIYYYRNEENIRDKNFYLALKRGKGKYLRLCNDTLRFKEGVLEFMLNHIGTASNKNPLFFIQNISFLNSNVSKETNGACAFIDNVSYWVTWIANFGVWKENLNKIVEPEKYAKLQLTQVDWCFQIVSGAKSVLFFGDYFEALWPANKGGYNFFQIFVENYLFILGKYVKNRTYFEKEKYRLFRHYIIAFYYKFVLNSMDKFDTKNAWIIIMKRYWYCPYTYIGLLWARLIFLKKKLY